MRVKAPQLAPEIRGANRIKLCRRICYYTAQPIRHQLSKYRNVKCKIDINELLYYILDTRKPGTAFERKLFTGHHTKNADIIAQIIFDSLD